VQVAGQEIDRRQVYAQQAGVLMHFFESGYVTRLAKEPE
jgi:hypothetical protein